MCRLILRITLLLCVATSTTISVSLVIGQNNPAHTTIIAISEHNGRQLSAGVADKDRKLIVNVESACVMPVLYGESLGREPVVCINNLRYEGVQITWINSVSGVANSIIIYPGSERWFRIHNTSFHRPWGRIVIVDAGL